MERTHNVFGDCTGWDKTNVEKKCGHCFASSVIITKLVYLYVKFMKLHQYLCICNVACLFCPPLPLYYNLRQHFFSLDNDALSHCYFLDKPPAAICPVLHELILHPYRSDCCCQLFSKFVFEKMLPFCPLCRHEPFVLHHDIALQQEINLLKVQCDQCHWIGKLGIFQDHLMWKCKELSSLCYFIDKPPAEAICPVLHKLILHPYRSDCCSQLFSKFVFEKMLPSCPLCQHEPFVIHHDIAFQQTINLLKVQCDQCYWVGTLETFHDHLKKQCYDAQLSSLCHFIDKPPDEATCPVLCELILHPYRSSCCSHLFSEIVFEEILSSCPFCRDDPFVLKHDVAFQQKIDSLKVNCNKCHWIGTLGNFQDHLKKQCLFEATVCYDCRQSIQRAKLEVHKSKECPKRPFVCLHCSMSSTYEDITEHHLPQCAEKLVPCPNKCGNEVIQHKQLKEHIDQCPNTTLKCKYDFVGCKYTTMRNKKHLMEHHNNIMVDEHRALLVKEFQLSYKQLALLQHDNELLRTKYRQLDEQVFSHIECTMDDFYNKYSSWCSEPFYSHLGGYKMCIRVNGSKHEDGDSHLEVGICLMKGEFDQDLGFPFEGHATVQLVQVNETKLDDAVYKQTYIFSRELVNMRTDNNGLLLQQSFLTLNELHSISQDSPITKLKFRVTDIQAPSSIRCVGMDRQCSQLLDHLSHCPLKVEECNYCYKGSLSKTETNRSALSMIADGIHISRLQVEALKGQNGMFKSLETAPHSVYSRPLEFVMSSFEYYYKYNYEWISSAFYTHFGGYRLCLDVEGRGSRELEEIYLCVLVRLCAGDYDDELKFPFYGEITVQLVDHGPDKKHVQNIFKFHETTSKEVGDRVTALTDIRNEKRYDRSFTKFISFENLRRYKYLVNDTLTFRVTNINVTSGIKPLYVTPQQTTQLSTLLYLGMLTREEIVAELLKDYPRYKVSRHGLVDSLIARFIILFIGRGGM